MERDKENTYSSQNMLMGARSKEKALKNTYASINTLDNNKQNAVSITSKDSFSKFAFRDTKRNADWNKAANMSLNNCNFKYHRNEFKSNIFLENEQTKKTMFTHLSELSKKHPNDILLTILDKQSRILQIIEENNIKQDALAHLLISIGKACTSDLSANVCNLVKTVSCNSNFFLFHMQRHLVFLQKREILEKVHLDSIFFSTVLLEKFQSILPSTFSELISILLPLLDSTCTKCLKTYKDMHSIVSEKLREIDEKNLYFLKNFSPIELKRESKKEKLQLQEPPENFRSIPVLPTIDDIKLPCSFLRPNIVKGKYKNVEHYLDVQYRLLREDYIQPLRDGVIEYLNQKKSDKYIKNYKNIKVYYNVSIVSENFFNGELFHLAQFSDKNFSKIKWESNKRFLTGSLLCFSLDDFKTMLFASIARRDPKKLEEGLLYVRFEEITEVLKVRELSNFTVIETLAYFEAYRHNLNVLRELDEKTLPLKKYIIDVDKTVSNCKYICPTTMFDMRPLFIPLNKKYIIKTVSSNTQYQYPKDISSNAEFVTVMEEQAWPKAIELNLNDSQYIALKSAITKEFAIIQGPPGTGKTYIGLRVVQLLLHNLSKWFTVKTRSLPILVVCYTNHALDQFLEGILLFTQKICRIGGRGLNEDISKYNLFNLRESTNAKKLPNHIFNCFCNKEKEIRNLKHEINSIKDYFENSTKTVFNEFELKKHIPLIHYNSLLKYNHKNVGHAVYKWLLISESAAISACQSDNNKCKKKNCVGTSFVENEFESEDEADIEYIENQRNIDIDDSKKFFSAESEFMDGNVKVESSTIENKQDFRMIEYIKKYLEYYKPMEEAVAMQIECVWSIDLENRWKLYKYWLQKFIEEKQKKYFDLQEKLKTNLKELAEIRIEQDLCLLKNTEVVGVTTTGAAKYRHLVHRLQPVIVIAEEAAEVLESHIITSLTSTTQHVILIGDHQQLRPSPTVHMLGVKYDMNVSLFERMIKNEVDYCRLSVQHRMRPEIAALIVPHIYSDLKNHRVVTEFENIKGVKKNVFFVSHKFNESSENESKSKVNEHEARFIIQLCRYFILQGYESSQITVLTTYSGQLFFLKQFITDEIKKVRFTVVDNFQGEENDIILISFVRSNDEGIIGFLKVPNRVCVALSRAKKGLFCIGNFELLAEKSNLWKNIVETLNQNQSIGPSLQLACQNHPDVHNNVAKEADFKNVPEGGCNQKCEYRLPCGHTCTRMCHPYSHEFVRCEKPCARTCDRGHVCKRGHPCFEECMCEVLVEKTLQRCSHTVKEPCWKPEEEIKCKNPCKKTCEEGHDCQKKCFEFCGSCSVLVDKTLNCGRNVEFFTLKYRLPANFGTKLEHIVKVEDTLCGKTCQNRQSHLCMKTFLEFCGSCDVLVEKTLDKCGHTVKVACGKKVIICDEPCIKTCIKGHQCPKKCHEICGPCPVLVDTTLDKCGHTVTVACGERTIRCYKPCIKTCAKGHQCSKKCSEDCGSCLVLIDKTLDTCGHVVKVACGKQDICCTEPCIKTCKKGHKCLKMCFEVCGRCIAVEDKILKRCGHSVKAFCWKNDNQISCSLQCEKIMLCSHQCLNKCGETCIKQCEELCLKTCERGHPCYMKCFEECGPCTAKIDKTLKQCGHTVKVPCGMPEDKIKCLSKCKKVLNCSHSCTNKCGEPCLGNCMEFKEAQSPICGHSVKVNCYIADNSELLLKKCSEKLFKTCSELCNAILPCGHKCKGTCGQCYQGRLHIPCQETCKQILICGHKCKFICSKSCPPCQHPCENQCIHLKCKKKCSELCEKCTKTCEWSCIHLRCTRSCSEICDREPCNQSCPKILPCGHSCIGTCGEPCPKECRICDKKKKYLFTDHEYSARYVLLEKCKHVFEINYLNQWMTRDLGGNREIIMKTCPTCNTAIRKNLRYNNVIKNSLIKLEKVKQIARWNKEENAKLQSILLQKSVVITFLSNFRPTQNSLFQYLSSSTTRKKQELITIENIISITTGLKQCNGKLSSESQISQSLIDYRHVTCMWLSNFILKYFLAMSEYQLIQVMYEVHRLILINQLLKYADPQYLELYSLDFEKCSRYLLNYAPFDEASEKDFSVAIQVLYLKLGDSSKEMPSRTEFPLLKAINFSTGHWHECPEGHVYCIMKYVGSTKKVCYKCMNKCDDESLIYEKKSHKAFSGPPPVYVWSGIESQGRSQISHGPSHARGWTSAESRTKGNSSHKAHWLPPEEKWLGTKTTTTRSQTSQKYSHLPPHADIWTSAECRTKGNSSQKAHWLPPEDKWLGSKTTTTRSQTSQKYSHLPPHADRWTSAECRTKGNSSQKAHWLPPEDKWLGTTTRSQTSQKYSHLPPRADGWTSAESRTKGNSSQKAHWLPPEEKWLGTKTMTTQSQTSQKYSHLPPRANRWTGTEHRMREQSSSKTIGPHRRENSSQYHRSSISESSLSNEFSNNIDVSPCAISLKVPDATQSASNFTRYYAYPENRGETKGIENKSSLSNRTRPQSNDHKFNKNRR